MIDYNTRICVYFYSIAPLTSNIKVVKWVHYNNNP